MELLTPKFEKLDLGIDVMVKSQIIFQDQQEGFRIWEAGIVMARYLNQKVDEFRG
jgi:hypothetical protein